MTTTKVYVDGQAGTTGLKILERLQNRPELELLQIDPERRKDPEARHAMIAASDITFLCLPDAASREAVALAADCPHVRILDASTAHRTNPAWCYGFPELSAAHRQQLLQSKRTAVPGCYASGFISLVYPLVQAGLLPKDFPVTCFAASGYSGGGKGMIGDYEAEQRPSDLASVRFYGLGMLHKHLPEMQYVCGLTETPLFAPFVGDYYSGMAVFLPLHVRMLPKRCTPADVHAVLAEHYGDQKLVQVAPLESKEAQEGILFSGTLSGTNKMELFVFGNEDRILLCSRLDNLGKGASGAAVQCMNLMLGLEETTGLV